eukprot:TRINITY_DN14880_c0_g1_i1.p1 TRINITY_DN14880_c0_g1~~TRINITY_DN14880_c0_g1_i1.p1  ORF type:complete len:422 (-),score=28.80 TRINITY_DN14880_c0_g1_i1:161-1426(-)
MLQFPFVEELLQFPVDAFPFRECVELVLYPTPCDTPPTVRLHNVLKDENHRPILDEEFRDTYHRFIRDFVRVHLEEEFVLFEASPNLRIHAPRAGRTVGPHIDADYGHSPCEINFWLPLTPSHGTASLWTESLPAKGDFHSLDMDYGWIARFYGNQCLHFSKENLTHGTRVSLDFRIVRLRDFNRSGIPTAGDGTRKRRKHWALFSYYSVMGPAGEVTPESWPAVLASAIASSALDEQKELCGTGSFPVHPHPRQDVVPRRERSKSPEHQHRCRLEFGSVRNARLSCTRCAWIAYSSQYIDKFTFTNELGEEQSWIAENPDPMAPWGLGCLVCHMARHDLHDTSVPETAYSEFTFGAESNGLIMEALWRHGSNWESTSHDHLTSEANVAWHGHRAAVKAVTKQKLKACDSPDALDARSHEP